MHGRDKKTGGGSVYVNVVVQKKSTAFYFICTLYNGDDYMSININTKHIGIHVFISSGRIESF